MLSYANPAGYAGYADPNNAHFWNRSTQNSHINHYQAILSGINLFICCLLCCSRYTVDLVKHQKLRPPKPINVLQGQEARVKCDLHGTLTATLEWKKQTVSGDVPVPDSLVSVIKDSSIKRTRAVLKIKYVQMEDSGVYKCVSKAFGKTHFKLAYITVKGNSFSFN